MNKCIVLLHILFSSCIVFSQSAPLYKIGTGIIGFYDTDSVVVSRNASVENGGGVSYAYSGWPEMMGESIYGTVVWPCIADSAGWYKVMMSTYVMDLETGDILGDASYIGYVQHSKFVNYQSWDDYLKNKYLYGFLDQPSFFHHTTDAISFKCNQQSCLFVSDMQGEWMQITTIQNSDCTSFEDNCFSGDWLRWYDAAGKILVKLMPY